MIRTNETITWLYLLIRHCVVFQLLALSMSFRPMTTFLSFVEINHTVRSNILHRFFVKSILKQATTFKVLWYSFVVLRQHTIWKLQYFVTICLQKFREIKLCNKSDTYFRCGFRFDEFFESTNLLSMGKILYFSHCEKQVHFSNS